jgi:hypothetical protein
VAAVLLAPDGSVWLPRNLPGLGLRPTRYLQPGDSFLDIYPLRLGTDVAEPLVARATVNLFDFDSKTRSGFPALDESGHEVTPVVGQIKIVPKTWPAYQPTYTTRVNFADAIVLVGYDLHQSGGARENQENGSIFLNLYWQSLDPVDKDYIVFVHLLDAGGQVIFQADSPPTGNSYPTSWWSPAKLSPTGVLPPLPALPSSASACMTSTPSSAFPSPSQPCPNKTTAWRFPCRESTSQ